MREVKFRAWDKKSNKMLGEDSDLLVGFDGEVCLNECQTFELATGYTLDLMQYTGLKDKNGKEIYEGDILRGIDGWEDRKYGESTNYTKYNYVVEYLPEHAGLVAALQDEESNGNYKDFNELWWEVVGNIYENPESLI